MAIHYLTKEQKSEYFESGNLTGLDPIFNSSEMVIINQELKELSAFLHPNEKMFTMRDWHISSKWLYDICTNSRILDYVEGILGPNFFLWGSHFFAKAPNTKDTVAWHQDAYYWPLEPHNSVTVWLAFTDVDVANGAMKVIPKSHKAGPIKHKIAPEDSVLWLELEEGTFNESDAKSLEIKSGHISLHDDNIVHGSPSNQSDRWRTALTIRYSGTNVKCDLSIWPQFKAYVVRGEDTYKHNPAGIIPVEKYGRLVEG